MVRIHELAADLTDAAIFLRDGKSAARKMCIVSATEQRNYSAPFESFCPNRGALSLDQHVIEAMGTVTRNRNELMMCL
jgi:hypothetical protein